MFLASFRWSRRGDAASVANPMCALEVNPRALTTCLLPGLFRIRSQRVQIVALVGGRTKPPSSHPGSSDEASSWRVEEPRSAGTST